MDAEQPKLIVSAPEETIHVVEFMEDVEEVEELEDAWREYADSPEGKLRLVAEAATDAAKKVLLKQGWFPDQNGDWDFTLFEIERMLMEYVERYLPNK